MSETDRDEEGRRNKEEDTRRLADLHLQAQIPVLSHRIGELERAVREKFDNGITRQFEKIYDKINDLQCGVHLEKMKSMNEKIDGFHNKIHAIWAAFVGVVLIGIVLEYWLKH
jgi:hypothetical protein